MPSSKNPTTLKNVKEKLMEKTIIDSTTNCWLFQGKPRDAHSKHCRIQFNFKLEYIHRISAHIHWGYQLDSSMLVLHKRECPNPNCWNPDHLYEGDRRDNVMDSLARGTHNFLNQTTTHCPQGHEYTPENTAINSASGKKYCKECNRLRAGLNYISYTENK